MSKGQEGCEILRLVAESPALVARILKTKHFLVMILSLREHGVEKGVDQDSHCIRTWRTKAEACSQ